MKRRFTLLLIALCCFFIPQSGFSQNCMQIGVGLAGPAYWENGENAFIDQMRYRGAWLTFNHQGSSPWNTGFADEIPMDSVGFPNAGVPYATPSGGLQRLRIVVSANGRVPLGRYAFLYDGFGEFSFFGFSVDSLSPGRIEVTLQGTGNVWIHLDSSSVAPNHARNFRLVPLAQEVSYEQDVFKASFLEKLQPFHTLRFMDWFHTNGNPLITWDMRSTPNSYSQADSAGIAYEYAIDLCNRTAKHPWVCVPHMADSLYIRQMAAMWHNNLDPNLDLYLEYSNEVWNWQFAQAQWNIQQTQWYPSHWPLNTLYDPNQNFGWNSGRHSRQVFRIWREVWGDDSLRVKRVLGTQAAWPQAVAYGNIAGANEEYDYLSPTWYFGLSTAQSAGMGAGTTAQQVIDTCRNNYFNYLLPLMKMHYQIAGSLGGKGVIHYEGGQHISAYGDWNHPALQAFYDAQNHPAMYDLYDDVLDSLRDWGSELAMAFVLGGGNSVYGSWGHIPSVDSTSSMSYSPKYEALLDNLLPEPAPNLGADSLICDGESLTLDAGGGFQSYAWSNGATSQSIAITTTGSYEVSVTDGNGCLGSDEFTLNVASLPTPNLGGDTLSGGLPFLLQTSATYPAYLWSTGDTQDSIYVTNGGNYWVEVTDSNGCTGRDSVHFIIVASVDAQASSEIRVYPNPTTESVQIRLDKPFLQALAELYSSEGKRLYSTIINQASYSINVEHLPAGIYLLQLTQNGAPVQFRIIKQ